MLSLAKFVKKEIQLRENIVGTGFNGPPRNEEKYQTNLTAFGETGASIRRDEKKKNKNPPSRVTVLGK